MLGDPNIGGAAGEQPAGRREINWDGVPPAATNTDNFSPTAFQGRGAIFSTPGTGLRVSDNNFADVEPTYGSQFRFFSPIRTFAAVGSNVMDVHFVVAGTSVPALVRGFGAVFSDVDRDFSSSIEYFDADGNSLGRFYVPNRNPNTDRGLSFLGVDFGDAVVARVRIISGNAALGVGVMDRSNGGTADVAVLDDFFYGEPRAFIIP